MSEFWYYAEGDETRGPIAFDQLIKLLSQLRTPGGVLVWREGFDDWQATENVREIVEKLIRPPPLRPRSSFTTPAITETITEAAVDDTVARYQQQFRDDKSLQEGRETVARYQEQFQKAKPAPTPQQSGPTGLGGWLALLGFGLAVAPFKSLLKIVKEWAEIDDRLVQLYPVAIRGLLAIEIAYLLLWVCAATLFFMHSRKFPRFFIWVLIATILESLVGVVWLKIYLPSNFDITKGFGPEVFAWHWR